MLKEFNPELILEPHDVAALALVTGQDGYKVIHKIIRHEVDRFILALINTPTGNDVAVLEGHRVAKVAAQMYDGVTNKINLLVGSYTASKNVDTKPKDDTEGLIDLGPVASTQDDIDGFEESQY